MESHPYTYVGGNPETRIDPTGKAYIGNGGDYVSPLLILSAPAPNECYQPNEGRTEHVRSPASCRDRGGLVPAFTGRFFGIIPDETACEAEGETITSDATPLASQADLSKKPTRESLVPVLAALRCMWGW